MICWCNVASSEDSDSDSSADPSPSNNHTRDSAHAARVLSDEELNQLGAKLLRAEMMGDEVSFQFLSLLSSCLVHQASAEQSALLMFPLCRCLSMDIQEILLQNVKYGH